MSHNGFLMDCKNFELTASAYLDRQLREDEASRYQTHLSGCADCRLHLVEIEAASLMIRDIKRPEVPRELRSYTMCEAARRARREVDMFGLMFEWLLKLNPKPVAYVAGLVISVFSFVLLFSSFRPIPVSGAVAEQSAIFPAVYSTNSEYHNYNDLPPDKGSTLDSDHYYQLPRVLENGALVSFSHIAYQKAGNEDMWALVEVSPDGRARLVDVLDAPKDPYIVEQLWWSLRNRTFQPAIVSGRPVTTRIVLVVEKVDVSG
jgi:putative zinc finger protein